MSGEATLELKKRWENKTKGVFMCLLCGQSVGRKAKVERERRIISSHLKPEALSHAGLRPCMGSSWSIIFHALVTEGDGPSDMPRHENTLSLSLKYPKSLAPLWLCTKVRVHSQTKGWGKKVKVTIATLSRLAGFISKGPCFLLELQESEAIYLHHKTERLEKSKGRGKGLLPASAARWYLYQESLIQAARGRKKATCKMFLVFPDRIQKSLGVEP